MSGIYPLSGELKIRVEREAASVRLEQIITITELESTIQLLEHQLCIAHAKSRGLRVEVERLADIIRARPLSPRPDWSMPDLPICDDCHVAMKPVVYKDRGWAIGHACPTCRIVTKCSALDWPFEDHDVVYQSDLERLGFVSVDEENLQADFSF